MLPDVIPPRGQCSMEQVSNPFDAQILEFCESELFQETMQSSEVASSSNCCYEEQSSFPPDATTTIATAAPNTANYPLMFEEEIMENEISTPIDITNASHFNHLYPFSNQDQIDLDLLRNQIPTTIDNNNDTNDAPIFPYSNTILNDHVGPTIGRMPLPTVCEENSLSSMPPMKFMGLKNNCLSPNYSFIDPSTNSYVPRSMEGSEIFKGNYFLGNNMQPHELESHGDNGGILGSIPPPRTYNSNELQALSNESRIGGGSCTTPLASEITSLESETFRVATKLTREERKEKIRRYMMKRNQRNFSKKIKYACRKTLADSRPRVRGRFAKNDETDENGRFFDLVVKDEEQSFDSSDILAHISGVDSFKRYYPIQSWT